MRQLGAQAQRPEACGVQRVRRERARLQRRAQLLIWHPPPGVAVERLGRGPRHQRAELVLGARRTLCTLRQTGLRRMPAQLSRVLRGL